MRKLLAIVVCALVVVASTITYFHIIAPSHELTIIEENDNEYGFIDRIDGELIHYAYIDKDNATLEIKDLFSWSGFKNLKIPAQVVKNGITYRVISVTDDGSIHCDTLFIPATIEYFNYEVILNKCCANINYIIVEPGNKYYKSVDGNLYHGDSLVFDTKVINNHKTY